MQFRELDRPSFGQWEGVGALLAIVGGAGLFNGRDEWWFWLLSLLGLALFATALRPTLISIVRGPARIRFGPRIKLCGEDAFHVVPAAWPFGTTDVLHMRFINAPSTRADTAVARGIRVRFQCEAPSFKSHWLDARLNDSPQPKPGGGSPEIQFNLDVGQWRQVNLALKEPSSSYAFLFNNDSYNFPRVSNPHWRIPPGEFVLTVRIEGSTNAEFRCTVANRGAGKSLAVISSEGEWSLPELVAQLPS